MQNMMKLTTLIGALMVAHVHLGVADDYPVGKEPKYDPYHEQVLTSRGVSLSIAGLSDALRHPDMKVRSYAALVIKQRGYRDLEGQLLTAFNDEQQDQAKMKMADTLVAFGSEVPIGYLRTLTASGDISPESIMAAGLLAEMGDVSAYSLIKKAIVAESQTDRLEAIYRIKAFKDRQGERIGDLTVSIYEDYDQVLTSDKVEFVRREAARELSDLATLDALRVLEKHAHDDDEKLRQMIGIYIEKMEAMPR